MTNILLIDCDITLCNTLIDFKYVNKHLLITKCYFVKINILIYQIQSMFDSFTNMINILIDKCKIILDNDFIDFEQVKSFHL